MTIVNKHKAAVKNR